MNETELQDTLVTLIEEVAALASQGALPDELPDELADVKRVRTYADVGVLTQNAGLIVVLADGSEFQLTIVQSR